MLPILQGEKFISPVSATGLMMNCELASQDATLLGQQLTPLVLQPPEHEQPSAQSCYDRKDVYEWYVKEFECLAYNGTEVVSNLVRDDLPFSTSSRGDRCPGYDRRRATRGCLLAQRHKPGDADL